MVITEALEHTELSPRELSCKICDEKGVFLSESSIYRILKARGLITSPAHILLSASKEFHKKTTFVHEMWQTDFTYFKIIAWGWYYLSSILDDYSRYIVYWDLFETMQAEDVRVTVDNARKAAGLKPGESPILLSDNASCYLSIVLKNHLRQIQMKSIHGKPAHPQTQGKIERYHRTMKNAVKLDNYYHPEELKEAI